MKPERIREIAKDTANRIENRGDVVDYLEDLIEEVLEEQRTLCIVCDEPAGRLQLRCEECFRLEQETYTFPLEKARQIVGDMVNASTWTWHGKGESPDLSKYNLREMLDANHRVKAENGEKTEKGTILHVICADRLVAALYTLYNYQAESPKDSVEPIAEIKGKVLCCIQVEKGQDNGDQETVTET